jgi:predicted lipoprotein with Yx(FWY)xxD motif
MFDSGGRRVPRGTARRSALVGVLSLIAAAVLVGAALAASYTVGSGRAKVKGRTEIVAVNAKGATLYTLSGETRRHLKCTSSFCFEVWPPYKISARAKLTKARGVSGRLSKLHRHGFYQVMLNGHPLYTYAPDMGKRGSAMGEGVVSFGGTWHVIRQR